MSIKRKEIKKEVTIVGQTKSEPKTPSLPKAKQAPISFDQWWLQTQQKLKLKPELKQAVRKHFESRGFINNSEKFNDGLRDFGFNT